MKTDLKIDFATHEAAKYACENWHYSKKIPTSKLVKFGVWEDNIFKGVVIFGLGASLHIGKPYNLKNTEVCELVRVALTKHSSSVSKILSICIKLLKKHCPGIKLIVSFADAEQGHHGGIYQASNWIYVGYSKTQSVKLFGNMIHPRSILHKYKTCSFEYLKKIDPSVEIVKNLVKHKYLMPLNDEIKKEIIKLSKPFPKRGKQAMAAPTDQRRCDSDLHAPNL